MLKDIIGIIFVLTAVIYIINKFKIIIPINDPGKKKLGINFDKNQDMISPNKEKPIIIATCLNIFIK